MKLSFLSGLIALGASTIVSPAAASLPPLHDSIAKINAVLGSEELAQTVGAHRAIRSVSHLKDLRYYVKVSAECGVVAELTAHVPAEPGPTTYTVKRVSPVMCE